MATNLQPIHELLYHHPKCVQNSKLHQGIQSFCASGCRGHLTEPHVLNVRSNKSHKAQIQSSQITFITDVNSALSNVRCELDATIRNIG